MDTNGHTSLCEDYVSFEIAKLLKEKGFDEVCGTSYETITNEHKVEQCSPSNWGKLNQVKRPTLQMAMKWLREVHNIAIETEWEHLWYAYIKPMTSKPSEEDYYQCESSKYEEACEAGIKYCLENLI